MNEETVRQLARAADLPLGEERLALIVGQLGPWLAAANELSRKLAAHEHEAILPITTFRHPEAEGSAQ